MSYNVQDFETEVIRRSFEIPVLVDFWAEWCGPCRILGPVLERLEKQNVGQWVLAKVNTEVLQDVAAAYGIRNIPNVKLFSEGVSIAEFTGALPEYAVAQWLRKFLPSRNRKTIAQAAELIEEQRVAEARQLLETVLGEEPENQQAKTLLAKTLLFSDTAKAAEIVQSIDDPAQYELSESIRTIAHVLDGLSRTDAFPDSGVKNEYIAAIGELRMQHYDSSLEKFIGIIRTDRYYDDDGSRKACIAIFKLLGEEHPTTLKYRREFGSALYV